MYSFLREEALDELLELGECQLHVFGLFADVLERLLYHLLVDPIGSVLCRLEYVLDLLVGNEVVAVGVEEAEGVLEAVLGEYLLDRERAQHELLVVNVARSIQVHVLYQIIDLLFIEVDAANLAETFDQFISREFAVPVRVEQLELLRDVVQLVLTQQVLHEKAMDGLLQTRT